MLCPHLCDACRVRAACKHLFKTRTAAIENGVKAELPDLPVVILDTPGVRPANRAFVVTGAATKSALRKPAQRHTRRFCARVMQNQDGYNQTAHAACLSGLVSCLDLSGASAQVRLGRGS